MKMLFNSSEFNTPEVLFIDVVTILKIHFNQIPKDILNIKFG